MLSTLGLSAVVTIVRRFLALVFALFVLLVAPALASNHTSELVSVDTTVPTDGVIDIVFDTTTSSTTTTAPTTTVAAHALDMGIATPKYLLMDSHVTVGTAATESAIVVTGISLSPATSVTLKLQPGDMQLDKDSVDQSGNATLTAVLPTGLSPGAYMLASSGTTSAGEQVATASAFIVDAAGIVTKVVAPSEGMSGPPTLRQLKRALSAGAPLYDSTANVATSAAIAVGAVVLGTVAGGGGSGGDSSDSGDAQSESSTHGADSSTGSNAHSHDRDTHSQGDMGSIDTDVLRRVDSEHESWGDRTSWWRLPGAQESQRLISSIYKWTESHSVLLSRILVDGQWLRATFGPLQLIVAYIGLLCGVLGSVATHGTVLLPPIALVLFIVVLSFADALTGLMAWLSFSIIVLARGGIHNVFDLRTLLGMAIVFIALPLLANHARPLRRMTDGTVISQLDRIGDYLLVPIVAAFAAGAALSALNGLSGLQLVQPHDASTIRWVTAIAVVCRMVIEDVVVRGFPSRLKATQLDAGDGLGVLADYGTVFMKAALFLLASSSFFGLGWRTWFMVALMTLVPLLKITQDRYPNFWWINHWFPHGVLRSVIMILVGSWFAQWVLSTSSSPNAAKELAPFLMLPGVGLGLIDLFGRSGSKWPKAVWIKLTAAALWIFVVGTMLGVVNV